MVCQLIHNHCQEQNNSIFNAKLISCHPTFIDKKVRRLLVVIRLGNSWSQKCDNFPVSFTDQVRLGYLDVAIAKIFCETFMPSCTIDSQQRLFRCRHRKKICKTCEKFENLSVKLAEIGRKNIWSVKVGVHQLIYPKGRGEWLVDVCGILGRADAANKLMMFVVWIPITSLFCKS